MLVFKLSTQLFWWNSVQKFGAVGLVPRTCDRRARATSDRRSTRNNDLGTHFMGQPKF